MANMKPMKVDRFTDENEQKAYELLRSLDDTYTVVYEPTIGRKKTRTPDFILLSERYGLIVLDVKFVKLENIRESDSRTIVKQDGVRLNNFNQTVKGYSHIAANYLLKELNGNSALVDVTRNRLNFSYASGVLLFINEADKWEKEDVAKKLSLAPNVFLLCDKVKNAKEELEDFLQNLERPFKKGLNLMMQNEISKKIFLESDVNANEFTNSLSANNLLLKDIDTVLNGDHFEKSKQLKKKIITYADYAQKTLSFANKNQHLGLNNLIDELLNYKLNLEEEKFTIAIFGYFSTGKSTFLNTLLQTDALPMNEARTTAAFTKMRHIAMDSDKDVACGEMIIKYKTQDDIELNYLEALNEFSFDESIMEEFKEFNKRASFQEKLKASVGEVKIVDYSGTKRDNIKNAKKVLSWIIDTEIEYGTEHKLENGDTSWIQQEEKAFFVDEILYYHDNEFLRNVEIVDTPGFGSANTLDTIKTKEFIKEANAIIFLTEAATPLDKEHEINFLEDYRGINERADKTVDTSNLFVVANKADAVSKSVKEIKEAIDTSLKENFEDAFVIESSQVYTLSSKYHFEKEILKKEYESLPKNVNENGFTEFTRALTEFLTNKKDREMLKSSFKQIDDTISQMEEEFKNKVDTKNRDLDLIRKSKANFENNKKEIKDDFSGLRREFKSFKDDIEKKLQEALDTSARIAPNRDKKTVRDFFAKEFSKYSKQNVSKSSSTDVKATEFIKKYTKEETTRIIDILGDNIKSMTQDALERVNTKLEKLVVVLEKQYSVGGLSKKFSSSELKWKLNVPEINRGIVKKLYHFFGRPFTKSEAIIGEEMTEKWNNNIFLQIENSMRSELYKYFTEFDSILKGESDEIVQSIGQKIDEQMKLEQDKRKDFDTWNKKIGATRQVFNKITKTKQTIQNQYNALYPTCTKE